MPRLRTALLGVDGVEAIHDVLVWSLSSGLLSASVHIRARPGCPRDAVLAGVQRVLREQGGVDHATIQIEQGDETICHIEPEHA
jgi:cobalt-zinc-cadmium efflux system protein